MKAPIIEPSKLAPSSQGAGTVSPFAKLILIFGTSALVLVLQLLQSRILAVQFWHHLVYFVITLGFLGFAASGTYLSVSRRIHLVSDRSFFAICLGGLALGILVSRTILAGLPNANFGFLNFGSLLPLTIGYTALMIPYFFAGLLVGGALRREPRAGSTLYFASLAGSAAGCLLFVALMRPLGAPVLLQFLFLAAALPAMLLWRPSVLRCAAYIPGIILVTMILGLIPVQPDRGKQYWSFPDDPVEFSEWNAISRIDVISSPRIPSKKFVLIDGDAQAPMFKIAPPIVRDESQLPLDTPHRDALYALAGTTAPDRVLVIGVGGGADVLTAKRHGARIVDAVEINPTTARIMKGEYANFTGHLLTSEGVTLYNEDGRSFAARTSNQYDAVMIFAVDSLAASSTGAYVLMENYLYTSEAFRRYWQVLSPRGVLQIGRWHNPKAPSESLRVFTQAYEVLRAEGVTDPGQHLAVVGDPLSSGAPFADILVSKQPLTQTQADAIRRFAEKHHFEVVYLPPALGSDSATVKTNAFHRFAEAYSTSGPSQFYAAYPFKVAPVTDNNPFFFSYRRWSDLLPHQAIPSVTYYDNIIGTKPLVLLVALVGLSVTLVLILVIGPLFWAHNRQSTNAGDGLVLLFFALIGIGFMFIEIPLLQHFVLLLGHPTYSMSVSLPGILLGAAFGSYLSGCGRLSAGRRVGLAVLGIVLAIVALQAGHEILVRHVLAWPLAIRLTVVGLITGVFGLFMGLPFPTVVAALAHKPHLISLGWTVNGGTTVVASVLAIPVAMTWGFSMVMGIAAACYICAWLLLALWGIRAPSRESTAPAVLTEQDRTTG